MHIIVLGCGVSGLSCGIRLLEAGHTVSIWAWDLPPHTTSDIAAAIWFPYHAHPRARVLAWAHRTYAVLQELAAEPGTGVTMIEGIELWRSPQPFPWWADCVPACRRLEPQELPPGYRDGFRFTVPLAEMPIYLDRYLTARFARLGGDVQIKTVASLAPTRLLSSVLINCTGLGARELVGDDSLFPIKGQIAKIGPIANRQFIFDDDHPGGPVYIIPRSNDCILGGTAVAHDWSLDADPAVGAAIVDRCRPLLPEPQEAGVLEHRAGLRPGRPTVRVEAEMHEGQLIIHNYGHGGAGITLSWGCAEEVAGLVQQFSAARP